MQMKMMRAVLAVMHAVTELEAKIDSKETREQIKQAQQHLGELLDLAEGYRKDG